MHTRVDHVGGIIARQKTAGRQATERFLEQLFGGTYCCRTFPLRSIENRAVGLNNVGHVFGALHAPLDLEAHDPSCGKFRQQIDRRQVVGRKIVTVFSLMMITPPAGLSAAATVAAHTTEPGGKAALAGEGKTVGAMYEVFEIKACFALDRRNFRQGQLAGKHGTGKAEAFRHLYSGGIMNGHLRRSMQLQSGEMTPGQTPDTHILEDHRINANRLNGGQNIDQM